MDMQTGIVNCSVYRNGKKLDDVTVDAISDVLKDEGTFVWVGLLEPNATLMRKIQEEFGLHELAVEDAQKAHQRPKLEEYGESLFVVLPTAMLVDNDIQFGETHVFVGRRFVISVRHGPSMGYAKVRERTESMPDRLASGPGYVLYSIIDFVVDHYQPCMDNLQGRFRTFEQALFNTESKSDNLQDFYERRFQE